MKPHMQYLGYVLRHKWFVFHAGLKTGAPLWRLFIHDASKFSRAEWGPYVRRFYGGRHDEMDKRADPEEFQRAWTHHWHHNAHHPEHWVTAEGWRMTMPEPLVREMVADWFGAGRAKTGSWDMQEWYAANRERLPMSPGTLVLADCLVAEAMRAFGHATVLPWPPVPTTTHQQHSGKPSAS